MAVDFRFIVIGRGMMGAAAARHLAKRTDGVAVIGPDEPDDRKRHDGVFASHYDEGRITRTIDPDLNWALLANRSIARYGEIARDSGIDFYREVGCLVAGPAQGGADDYLAKTRQSAASLGIDVDILEEAGLRQAFPFFALPPASGGVFEAKGAGHISPRRLVKAQSLLAEKAGATVIRDVVVSVRQEGDTVAVETSDGTVRRAEKAIVAAGSFSIADNLLPCSVDVTVYGRTITFFEIGEAQAERLAAMPSLILDAPGIDIYLLPPIRYPDGRFYVKIGGDPDDLVFGSEPELRAWFKTDGREVAREHLVRILSDLVPEIEPLSVSAGSCAVSRSPSGYPMIGYTASSRIAVLMGCAGTSAKSSDEIGRLGAELLLEGGIADQGYSTDFASYFR